MIEHIIKFVKSKGIGVGLTIISILQFCQWYLFISQKFYSGDYSAEETPVPIPNTEVKLCCADGTVRETSVGE